MQTLGMVEYLKSVFEFLQFNEFNEANWRVAKLQKPPFRGGFAIDEPSSICQPDGEYRKR